MSVAAPGNCPGPAIPINIHDTNHGPTGALMLHAMTREVSPTLAACELTHLPRQPIDAARAALQHRAYLDLLTQLGAALVRLPPLPDCPDAVFVEDTCVVLDEV